MRIALLSLIETVPGGSSLRGALPWANGQLAMLQVDLARQAGAAEILCLVSAIGQPIRQIESYAVASGLGFRLVRSVADISVNLASDDDLLVIADGLYVAPQDMAALAGETGPFVASFAPGEATRSLIERFERIDINHIWAGLACVRARDLVEARDLPDDWSVQSALLRLAVQRGYRRLLLPFSTAESGRMAIVRDGAEAQSLAMQQLAGPAGGPGSRLLRLAPLQTLARKAWASAWVRPALRSAALGLPLAAIGLAVAHWSAAALGLLAGSRLAGHAADRLFNRFIASSTRDAEQTMRSLAFALAFIVVTVLSVAASQRLAGVFVALILPALALLLARTAGPLPQLWPRLAGSFSLMALAAGAAVPFAMVLPMLMIWGVVQIAILLWQTRPVVLVTDPAKPHI